MGRKQKAIQTRTSQKSPRNHAETRWPLRLLVVSALVGLVAAATFGFGHFRGWGTANTPPLFKKGIFCFSHGDLSRAREHLQKAVAWDPYSSSMREQLAVVSSAEGRTQDALDTLKEGILLLPRPAQ